jgi:hypothetical protein
MSDERPDPAVDDRPAGGPVSSEPTSSPPPAEAAAASYYAGRPRSSAAVGLGVLLLLVIAAVLLSPYWAPALIPLLPWGGKATAGKVDALAARVAALEQRPPIDLDPIKSAQTALAQRLAGLEQTVDAVRQNQEAASGLKSAGSQLAQRVEAIAAQSSARNAAQTADLQKVEQELAQRSAASGDLAARLATLEHQVKAQASADRSGSVLLLSLLQMREAVQQGQPFPAEYAAFEQMAARDPAVAAAARPLGDAAREGVASRAALIQELANLARPTASAEPAAGKRRWWAAALDRLRGLVTVRRVDTAGKPAADPIEAARADLAQGDLAGAVAAVEQLSGAEAKAAQPWLLMARERLAAETALSHLQQVVTARLGSPVAASPAATAPASPPAAAPASPPAAAPAPVAAPAAPKTSS